ncbi:MAG TPA: acetoacetate--CoA ligase [Steroidobacteraceae bacterium]|jgi:acetoacetyl-CoA synthetase|nr:acetoacetate--CoA ligase [Steroidobacteraceae bacterium]
MSASDPLWRPSAASIRASNLQRFADFARQHHGAPPPKSGDGEDYWPLWRWSVAQREAFWEALHAYARIVGDRGTGPVLQDRDAMPGAEWFTGARLNYAENLLAAADDAPAIFFANEQDAQRSYSYGELRSQVATVAAGLAADGVVAGDVVAGYLPNIPEAVIAMLAATSLGAVWTSTSPDFGLDGVFDRFSQVAPKVLFTADGYHYAGKAHDSLATVVEVIGRLPSLRRCVVVPYVSPRPAIDALPDAILWPRYGHPAATLRYERLPFASPLFVMYSSGTTGKPKCILHGVGGTLLQLRKEHLLHADLAPGDRLFFFTTCGWMMWNWLVTGLASGAAIVLYDGSPQHPDPGVLWRLAEHARITHFGTSPRYLAALQKSGYRPAALHDLSALRSVLSTGSPLSAELFDYVYADIKSDQQLASISGGTDILSCFCLGVPWLPVHRGEIQGPGLGMAVQIRDDAGQVLREARGELVCAAPFPSMPLGFVNDPGGRLFRAAYFERYPGVWHHGDYAIETAHGGYLMLGRSDAVLNPGGVRIGTAEIYRQVEKLPEVLESLAIGQKFVDAGGNADERIVLFLRLREGVLLDESLEQRLRQVIRSNTTPRHVPARFVAVADIPRTRSGKLVELAVSRVVHGQPVTNLEALANPEALEFFRDLPQLRD